MAVINPKIDRPSHGNSSSDAEQQNLFSQLALNLEEALRSSRIRFVCSSVYLDGESCIVIGRDWLDAGGRDLSKTRWSQLLKRWTTSSAPPFALHCGHYRAPVNLIQLFADSAPDPLLRELLQALREDDVAGLYLLPLRDPYDLCMSTLVITYDHDVSHEDICMIFGNCCELVAERMGTRSIRASLPPGPLNVTGREKLCIANAARGLTEKETGLAMGISANTVHAHLENVKRKMRVCTKAHLVAKALQLKIVNLVQLTD